MSATPGAYVARPSHAGAWGRGRVHARREQPLRGGAGHVGRVVRAPDADGRYATIDGNHGDRVAIVERRMDDSDLCGFIAYPRDRAAVDDVPASMIDDIKAKVALSLDGMMREQDWGAPPAGAYGSERLKRFNQRSVVLSHRLRLRIQQAPPSLPLMIAHVRCNPWARCFSDYARSCGKSLIGTRGCHLGSREAHARQHLVNVMELPYGGSLSRSAERMRRDWPVVPMCTARNSESQGTVCGSPDR